jgi:hypothetical protein
MGVARDRGDAAAFRELPQEVEADGVQRDLL